MPINYQNGKIYKIYSYENDDIYYGSTCETLSRRLAGHKRNFKKYKEGNYSYTRSFKILEYESAKIELVENFCCNSKEELLQREGYYIRNNNCVNKNIAGRTKKEWEEENKQYIKILQKDYYDENKEQIKEQHKKYYEQHKEHIKEQTKEYCEKNKENIKEWKKQYREQNRNEINERQRQKRKEIKEQALMLKEDTNINI